jgi:flagellar biosynthesis protein FlhF
MKIKRFLASDMRQAIHLVREQQGPDAVILSSRHVEGGTEIVAAIDYDEELVNEIARESPPAVHKEEQSGPMQSQPCGPANRETPDSDPSGMKGDALGAMRSELNKMRSVLEHQLRRLKNGDDALPETSLLERLSRLGLTQKRIDEVMAEVRKTGNWQEDGWAAAREILSRRIAVFDDDVVNHGGVMALVGPTGVGKTTTVAKLAARFALRFGRRHVALITTDTYRIGAQEQLLTFGKMLGVPVYSAPSRETLGRILHEQSGTKLVLIDNAGLSQRDLRLAAQLGDLSCIPFIKTYLVVSATTQAAGLEEVFSAFGRGKLQGCILTKLDEATTLGHTLETLMQQRLPLVYACDGQQVPEDIQTGGAIQLVDRAEKLGSLPDAILNPTSSFTESRAANGHM